jgi:putative transposase
MAHYTYKYRIYPTKVQEAKLASHFGSVRYVYNHFLERRKLLYLESKEGTTYNHQASELTLLKKELVWLKDTNSQALQYSLKCLEASYNNFFEKRAKFPRFHSRRDKQSFTAPQAVRVKYKTLYIPKFLEGIKLRQHRPLEGEIVKATITRNQGGYYFACILVEKKIDPLPVLQTQVGIDLGLKTFVTCSNGQVYKNIRAYKTLQYRLRTLQQSVNRKVKGSKNRDRANTAVAKLHCKIANIRMDYLHKVSREIVNENQVIVMETLNVKGMMANHKLAKSIADVSLNEFVRQLTYKSLWAGRTFIKVDRWFPSSKTCSGCGFIMDTLPLDIREWDCPSCGEVHDRDYNASVNILCEGLRTVGTTGIACGPDVRLFSDGKQLGLRHEAPSI